MAVGNRFCSAIMAGSVSPAGWCRMWISKSTPDKISEDLFVKHYESIRKKLPKPRHRRVKMQSQVIILVALLAVGSQCSRPSHAMMERNLVPKAVLHLKTETITSPDQFKAEVQVFHYGDGQLEVNTWLHSSSSLVLEVVSANGKEILHLPPPVPNPDAIKSGTKNLKSGESETYKLSGLSIDQSFLPSGNYKVRFKGNFEAQKGEARSAVILESDWKEFTIQ
jgi:hypothetical protein